MTNVEELNKRIKLSGYRNAYLAEKLNLSLQGFYNKIKGIRDFKIEEMQILCNILGINSEDREKIFFDIK